MPNSTKSRYSTLAKKVQSWFSTNNPLDDEGLYYSDVNALWLVGSRARKTNSKTSDYDVAVIFPKQRVIDLEIKQSSLKLTEVMHMCYGSVMPCYRGLPVDIQLFFDDDFCLATYSKIILPLELQA